MYNHILLPAPSFVTSNQYVDFKQIANINDIINDNYIRNDNRNYNRNDNRNDDNNNNRNNIKKPDALLHNTITSIQLYKIKQEFEYMKRKLLEDIKYQFRKICNILLQTRVDVDIKKVKNTIINDYNYQMELLNIKYLNKLMDTIPL